MPRRYHGPGNIPHLLMPPETAATGENAGPVTATACGCAVPEVWGGGYFLRLLRPPIPKVRPQYPSSLRRLLSMGEVPNWTS
jgi:hypothetical protein